LVPDRLVVGTSELDDNRQQGVETLDQRALGTVDHQPDQLAAGTHAHSTLVLQNGSARRLIERRPM
jgi:hypothetical protein